MNCTWHTNPILACLKYRTGVLLFFFPAPESERKPLSTLFSQVFAYRFEPGSFLPPWSRTIIIIGTPKMPGDMSSKRQNVRCQGCRAECSTLKPSSLVSVKACQGKAAVCQGVDVLAPDIVVLFMYQVYEYLQYIAGHPGGSSG